MNDFETSVDAGSATSGGESPVVSSDDNQTAATLPAETSAATGSDAGAPNPILAAVEAALSGKEVAEAAPAQPPAQADPDNQAEPATPVDSDEHLLEQLLTDDDAFTKAAPEMRSKGFQQLRSAYEETKAQVALLEPDAQLGALALSEQPSEFLNSLANESPQALSNLLEAIVAEVPDVLIARLQEKGALPAELDNLALNSIATDIPFDLPPELQEVWNSLPPQLRDEWALESPAKRDDYLWMKNEKLQAEKTAQAEAAAAQQAQTAQAVAQYEENVWSAVLQQVGATPITGDPKVDDTLRRFGATNAYYDSMRSDPTVNSLMQQAQAAVEAGEMRKAAGLQAALIAAGKTHTLKALEPVLALARENAQLKQRLQSQQPQRFSINGTPAGQPVNNGAPANASEALSTIAQQIAAQFGMPLN